MIGKISLAWLQLTYQKFRFLVAIAGITFVVILMFTQLGFQDALYLSATRLHHSLQGDLFLISSQYKSLTSNQSFSRTSLYQVLGFNGVASVSPMHLGFAKFKNPENDEKYSIYVIGIEPDKNPINLSEVAQNLDKIKIPDFVLFDRKSRPEFGPVAENFESKQTEQIVEISPFNAIKGYRVRVVGLFSLGPSFGVDGNLIVSESTFLRIFLNTRNYEMIDIGAVSLNPGVEKQKILENIQVSLPKDVKIFTREEFINFEKKYWATRTPIGFILNLMLVMGFVVGVVIVYQILYSNISTQITAYATLKAIGYSNDYFLKVVFEQSIILAFFGYIPGFAISLCIYNFAMVSTQLPITMSINNMLIILITTNFMCMVSGTLAMNKLRSADPADIF
ncbi:FtsX-like permease family protein [Scytonema sp. UIC 10036]|uniref:ABC transporter permease DevC n=1 Tax=Scytonema sp. UIC 10036 TaxID=2304196 RepID=UPI0012DAC1BE|nr:ABC transporter permease DevC [Scytonema sp. UIC 10036]MUG99624.1 FtsX-like permease family protein [Scytonema sp. UIC 10036]